MATDSLRHPERGDAPTQRDRAPSARSALLHPLWWMALALLVLNDHVLKASEAFPALLSGKLSDFAGLLVAPILLAALCGVRSRRGLLAAHGLVALGFAGLQLSGAVAQGLVETVGLLGVHWQVWPDPTDLMALPMLWVSWRVFGAVRPDGRQLPTLWRRAATVTALSLGAIACIATSKVEPPHARIPGEPDKIEADAFVYNATDHAVGVHVRFLGDGYDINCDKLLADPLSLLSEDMFTRDGGWNQPPATSATVWPIRARTHVAEKRGCYAVILEVEDSEPVYVTWSTTDLPTRPVPIEPEGPDMLQPGAITIEETSAAIEMCPKGNVQVSHLRP